MFALHCASDYISLRRLAADFKIGEHLEAYCLGSGDHQQSQQQFTLDEIISGGEFLHIEITGNLPRSASLLPRLYQQLQCEMFNIRVSGPVRGYSRKGNRLHHFLMPGFTKEMKDTCSSAD
jgi:hypothetical protein